jgi:ATP sulfurylase
MKSENNNLVKVLIKKNQDCEKLEDALKAILLNTLHRKFNNDEVYKTGVLSNIEIALGKEEYDRLLELYS